MVVCVKTKYKYFVLAVPPKLVFSCICETNKYIKVKLIKVN